MAAVIPAGIGAILITLITFSQLSMWHLVDMAGLPLMGQAYAPLLAWGPLLTVLTVAYVVREVGPEPQRQESERPGRQPYFFTAPLSAFHAPVAHSAHTTPIRPIPQPRTTSHVQATTLL